MLVAYTISTSPVDLRRNNNVVPLPAELLDGFAHCDFRLALRVTLVKVRQYSMPRTQFDLPQRSRRS